MVVAPASIGWFEARLRVLPFKTPFLSVRCARCPSTKVGEVAASCKIKIKILNIYFKQSHDAEIVGEFTKNAYLYDFEVSPGMSAFIVNIKHWFGEYWIE